MQCLGQRKVDGAQSTFGMQDCLRVDLFTIQRQKIYEFLTTGDGKLEIFAVLNILDSNFFKYLMSFVLWDRF